jgi:hypothetical protein
MEEIVYQLECLGLPGFPDHLANSYYFTICSLYNNSMEFTGSYRIKIPLTPLNIEQEIATYPEQETFIFNLEIEHINIWNGVIEIKEKDLQKFLDLLKPHIVMI